MSFSTMLGRVGVTTLALVAPLSVGVHADGLPNFQIDESSVPGYAPSGRPSGERRR